jgi:hypothetical protein
VPDDLLARLDREFDRRATPIPARSSAPASVPPAAAPTATQEPQPRSSRPFQADRWHLLECFIAAQFLWGALLFVPGAQAFRAIIRALPYVSSALMALAYVRRVPKLKPPIAASFLVGALAVLVFNLLWPTTQLSAGLAQCVFQATIAAPIFWGWKAVRDEDRLLKVVRLIFLLNVLSAGLGLLQVYYPGLFMPPQFSTLGLQMNGAWVESLTYQGADGRVIIRPPGLTDQPGGAAIAGAMAAVLGLGMTLLSRDRSRRWFYLLGAMIGLSALYLTQVRSLLLMCIGAFIVLAAVMFRRGRLAAAGWLVAGGGALVLTSFLWATSVGGDSVRERFTGVAQQGALQTFKENRGQFLSYTLGELFDQYPFGAGVGRWGMMNVYFGDPTDLSSPPIYVEIQLTGWLLDGGAPMWFFYGGALLTGILLVLRLASQSVSPGLADLAAISLAILVFVVGMSFAGPVFNTQVGILFWFLVSATYGAGHQILGRRASRSRVA